MKNKLIPALKILGCVAAVYIIGRFLYYLFDNVMNGVFVDWFAKAFISTGTVVAEQAGDAMSVRDINWYALKSFLFTSLIILVLFIIWLVRVMSRRAVRKAVQETIENNANMLLHFGETGGELLPMGRDYALVESGLLKIKEKEQSQVRRLEQETQKKNDLITYLAHDLKTPLASVIGYLSLLEEVRDMPEERKQNYIQISLDKAFRLEELIDEFFDITRFNLHTMELNRTKVNLNFLLQQLSEQFYPILSEQEKELQVTAQEEIWIQADGDKLARALNNILKNAVAYSYPKSQIRIEAVQMIQGIRITFINQGNPIPAHQLDTIFDKFYRLDSARSTRTGGAGLGLAIAKEIVTEHGGQIFAQSDELETRFTVELPETAVVSSGVTQ